MNAETITLIARLNKARARMESTTIAWRVLGLPAPRLAQLEIAREIKSLKNALKRQGVVM